MVAKCAPSNEAQYYYLTYNFILLYIGNGAILLCSHEKIINAFNQKEKKEGYQTFAAKFYFCEGESMVILFIY